MENINDHCNKEENELNKSKNSSDGNGCAVREASNVILLVSNSSETGKYIQTLWYLKHINSTVAIETSNEDENEVEIVKISARDGDEVHNDEKLLVTSNTLISYVARSYRFVFVIDISPSTFIVDGAASCVPHSKIINRLQQCLEGLLVDGNFLPANKFSPEIFITICFYSPFIAFDEDRVIVQGYLLTKKNIDCILQYVQERFALFSNRLCWTVQPHLRKWNHERKKLRQRAGDLLPENFFRQQSHATDGFRDSMHGLLAAQMTSRTSRTDEGFINSEWSLMFMLRVGLIGLQLLPDTAQPNIVLITDAVCNVTDIHALQKLMVQLRNYSIACSFIQIQGDCNTNAVFGHFSSPGFLTFLARGTSGIYIPDEYQATADNGLDPVQSQSLLCKNLQLLDTSDNYIKDLIQQINPEFVEPYTCGVIRRMHYSMEYESYLEYFIRLRLHEGFILRELRVLKKGDDQSSILVELSLPWKPQVTIGYKICALSEDYTKRAKLKITVICEAQCGIIRDLLSDRCSINTTKQTFSDAYRHTIFRLLETDRMLIHVHSFNSLPDIFRLPPEVLKEKSLFRYVIKENKAVLTISTRELETLCSQNVTTANFVEFWRIISEFEERLWQSWSQVYTFRVILTHDHPLPPRLFLFEEPNVKVTSQLSLAVFYDMLAQMTTFSLVHGQTYVKFVEDDNDNHIPKSFYIVKLNLETQLVVIKLAFLDGLTVAFREQVIREFQRNFTSLSIERSCFFTKMLEFADVGDDCATVAETMQLPALTIINRPLEVMLARYKKIPLILNRIIRLEKTDETNRDLILHNSLAKYFCCRRYIWYLKKAFPLSSSVSCIYADFILHTILQRRLNEGFHIVYGDNGIINLVKHVDDMEQQLHCGSAVLQYIIFPPTTIRPMRIMKEHLEKIPPLSKIVRIRGVETKKSVPSGNSTLKSDLDLQLMTEMWLEPLAVVDPQYVTWSGIIQQQIRATDEDIICTLSTLDQVMSLCSQHYSCSHFTLTNCEDSWECLKCEHLSRNVEIMHNCFCLRSLLMNATERELLLLPTLSYQDADPPSNIRLRILLENLHCELAKASNVTIEVRNPNFWLEITDGIDQSVLKRLPTKDHQRLIGTNDGHFCPTRVYVSRLSPWRVVIIALLVNPQHVLMATSLIIPTLPLLIFHCDEPWIAHHLARNEPRRCETYVSDHRTKSPTSTLAHLNRQIRKTENFTKMEKNELELHWLSTSRISPAENRVHTSFDIHSYCEAIEDQLFSRALIGAVYQCLLLGVHIPYEDLVEVLEDRCEQSYIEVEGIDECVRFLCSHVANIRKQMGDSIADADDETRSNDLFKDDILYRLNDGDMKSCEEEQEDFRFAFDELLLQNFRKIPNFPSYFYFVRDNATYMANKNLTINLPETKNFNSGSSPCEDLEICYIEDDEDMKEREDDSARSNQSSISFESVTTSELSVGETLHLSDNAAVPLFLNFSCAVRFSNMDMYTFPIDHLPSCVMQLLKQCSNISKKNFTAMDLIGISFDIYVLSWPMRQFTLTQSDSCTVTPKTPDKSESFHKFTTYFDFDSPYSTTTSDVISQLPSPENEAVRRLECGITRLLHMETVFVLSRYDDVTLDTMHKVMVFIAKEQREKNDTIRFKVKLLQIVMVMEQVKAVRRLKERIKNFNLLYCKLEAHPESSNLFYCCHVEDVDLYEDTLRMQMRTAANVTLKSSRRSSGSFTERIEEQKSLTLARKVSSMEVLNSKISRDKITKRRDSSVPVLKADRRLSEDYAYHSGIAERTCYNDHELRDFWIILNVEMQQIQAFFCERYAHHHEKIFGLLLEAIQKECHTINQELLLEKMHSISECDDLLIENETESHKFIPSDLHDSIPDTKLTRSLINKCTAPRAKKNFSFSYSDEDEMDAAPYMPARVFYPPGHFACRIVTHHWFYVHPRLHIEKKGAGCSLVMGYDALRQGIEQFAVRNRRNLYVCCEDNKRNVFYMQLFASEESFRKRCLHCDTTFIDEMSENFQNNILLTVHGIHEPTVIIQSIVDAMQKRLELKVLEELTDILYKNPRIRLTAADIEFIQRDPAKPFAVHYCTLPNYIYGYLGSLYYYMYQQMLTFTAGARFRDCSGGLNRNSPLSHERFHSLPGSQTACNNYIPHFFLISRPPTKGSSNMGIACVETRIVNSSGTCIDSLKYARISPSTHSKLYPGGGKFRLSSNERFHELTRCITTSLPLPDSLFSEKTGGVSYLVQYTIWQVGDVGLATLQPIFRLALQQALCDLITEFGLLSIPLVELVSNTRYSSSNTLIVPYVTSEERIRSCSDASHLNIVAKPIRKTESHVQPPLLEHLSQQAVVRKSKSSANSNDCESNVTVNYQFIMVAAQWFDHVVSEVKNTEHQFSVKRHTFHCESDHSVRKIFNVIQDKLSAILRRETIIICQLDAHGSKRFSAQNSSNDDIITFSNDSGRIIAGENEEPSLIMLAYNHQYSEAILKYGADSRSNIIPTAVEEILHDQKASSMRFLPQIAPFVPRQHLLYLLSKGETATLYLYNYSSDAAEQVYQMVANVLSWQNARSRLLREIGLHKMGVTHLSGRITPTSEELVWLNSELLSEYEIPQHGSVHFDKRLVSGTHYIQAEPLMHLYRHTTLAFLPLNLNSDNLFEDQCSQMVFLEKMMKSMLHNCENFNRIHSELMSGTHEIRESDLLKIVSHSRIVHFVRSPLLLFPKWRKLVAVVRRGTENAMSFKQAVIADLPSRHVSGSKASLLENTSSVSHVRTTRSNTFSALLHSSDRTLRKLTKNLEEDEPCCLKIQFMLVESYVKYLTKNGLRLLDVTHITGQASARYSLHYDMQNTESSPNVWMYKAYDGGILFVHITIIEPHFSVQYLLWNVAQLNRLRIKCDKNFDYNDQRDLYALKDSIISKAHVHSFTYDFHLRMVATYLIGGQQVLFNYGYNTNEFLTDFLQYYNCRPPYACNCIYEEKITFPNLPVTNQKVWEYLLDEKRHNWRIVRLKTIEMDMPGQFMIVAEDDTECFGFAYKEIRTIVHENQLYATKTLNIKFYVMLVSHEIIDPLVENLEPDANCKHNAKISGEFKKLGLNVDCNTDSYRKSTEGIVTQNNSNNAWCAPTTHTRRRCHSGDNNGSPKEATLPRNYSNGMKLDECHSVSDEKTQTPKAKAQKLSILNNAPLRHRKIRPNFRGGIRLSDPPVIVPREQAFYIYYMSRRQKRLQKELEDSVMHYKRKLQMIIEDAVWHCKRNQLWDDMLEKHVTKRETVEVTEQWKLLARHSNDITSVLRLALSTSLTTTDVDNLLGYVKSESLTNYEPLLESLVSNLNPGLFFKLLIQHFGLQKCRLFCSSVKEHLVIITPEAQQDVFLFTAQNDEPLQMKLLAKERKCNESGSLLMEADHSVREQFNELVRCAASSTWMNLVHSSLMN